MQSYYFNEIPRLTLNIFHTKFSLMFKYFKESYTILNIMRNAVLFRYIVVQRKLYKIKFEY